MNKALNLFLVLYLISFSFELDCSSLSYSQCETYNTLNKLQCHQFSTGAKCDEVIIDDGCEINPSHQCVKTDTNSKTYNCYFSDPSTNRICRKINLDTGCKAKIPTTVSSLSCEKDSEGIEENQDCFLNEDSTACKKKTKSCELYSNTNCGGLLDIKDNKQCYYGNDYKCHEITLDDNCEVDNTNKKCSKKSTISDTDFDIDNNKCSFNAEKTECKKRRRECDEYEDTTKCNLHGDTCKKIKKYLTYGSPTTVCSIVTNIDSKCEIKSDGECVDKTNGGIQAYEKCTFNSLYTECKPENLQCNKIKDLTKCSDNKVPKEGYDCKQIEGKKDNCNYVVIDKGCKIDDDGKCTLDSTSTTTTKNKCKFSDDNKERCVFYEVNSLCKLDDNWNCKNDGLESTTTQKCAFDDDDYTKCRPRNLRCSDYSDECESKKVGTKKCSLKNSRCQGFTIDQYCTVTGGLCKKANDLTAEQFNDETEVCFFDYNGESCTKKNKVCGTYYNQELDCKNYDNEQEKSQCVKLSGQNYCKTITIDDDCNVSNENCVPKETIASNKICAFDNNSNPTSCKIRDKKCTEYNTDNSCNSLSNCAYISSFSYSKCYEVEPDSNCEVSNGKCIKKGGSDEHIDDNSICDFSYDTNSQKAKCQKRNKYCSEYNDPMKCNGVAKGTNYQCRYIGSCKNVTIDNYCQVDGDNNDCTQKSNTNLGENYYCAFYSNTLKNYCLRTEKKCNDYNTADCGNLVPESKTCVYTSKGCQNVQIDNNCYIENNECKGNSCSFDDDTEKNKCVYKKASQNNNSAFIKLNQIMILILLILF